MRSPNFWFVFKHGLMAIPQLPRLKESLLKKVSKFCIFTGRQHGRRETDKSSMHVAGSLKIRSSHDFIE